MFDIDWSDPQTFWLNVTNIVLGLVALGCFAIGVYAVGREAVIRGYKRMQAGYRSLSTAHIAEVPELGLTMADGGEPIEDKNKKA